MKTHSTKTKSSNSNSAKKAANKSTNNAKLEGKNIHQFLKQPDSRIATLNHIANSSGPITQRAPEPEEEELLQGKFKGMQRQVEPEEEELMQGKFATAHLLPVEEEEEPIQGKFNKDATPFQLHGAVAKTDNNTGMPDKLKEGIESLSGIDISDARVHYNSNKPASVQAHAFTQGTNIHVSPGQDKHLPHEAWHIVQQKQGRVQPTTEVNGMPVNNNPGLENEADIMGSKATNQ